MTEDIYCHFLQFCSITRAPIKFINALFFAVKTVLHH